MTLLTRSMSALTRSTSGSIEGFSGLSKGTTTATQCSPCRTGDNRNAMVTRQVYRGSHTGPGGAWFGPGGVDRPSSTCERRQEGAKRAHVKRRMCCRKCDRRGPSGGGLGALLQQRAYGRQGGRRFLYGDAGGGCACLSQLVDTQDRGGCDALRGLARAGRRAGWELNMRELVRTNNAVLITAIEALLNGAQIKHLVVDRNMSVLEGSIGIFPRRILVDEEQFNAARRLLEEAGFADELRPDGR